MSLQLRAIPLSRIVDVSDADVLQTLEGYCGLFGVRFYAILGITFKKLAINVAVVQQSGARSKYNLKLLKNKMTVLEPKTFRRLIESIFLHSAGRP